MVVLKTITGREIKVSANQSKRTFTIRTESATYRTYRMSQEEFDVEELNTGNDWQAFLSSTSDYYKVR